jgi:hypothetical protein
MASLPPSGSYKKLQFIHFEDRCLSPARSKNERSSVASHVMRNIKQKERIESTIRYHQQAKNQEGSGREDVPPDPSPVTYLGGSNYDPFASSLVPLHSRGHRLLQHFISVCMPSLYVMEDYRYKTWSTSPLIRQEIQSCTSDATRCYSTLAMASSFIELNNSTAHRSLASFWHHPKRPSTSN